MVSDVVIRTDDSEGVVLAKVIKTSKEIRSGDKKRVKTDVKTPIAAPAGCRAAGSLLWAPEMQGGRETPPGVVVLSVASRAAG